ncbi:unnamed protein product [Malus baccata var. baccata]
MRTFCPMRWKAWKAMPEKVKNTVALEEGFSNELEDRQDNWDWLCGHFQESGYVKKAKANKGNREKKTLFHHSGSRPFSYRMEAWRKEGSKFPEIDVFVNEFTSQLPLDTPIKSVDPPEDVGFHILTETFNHTFGQTQGTYCQGMGNARWRESRASSSSQSKGEVMILTQKVTSMRSELASYMS